jgi:Rad4 beta-hairpin domain 1/Rad4 transglutaminase-like domain
MADEEEEDVNWEDNEVDNDGDSVASNGDAREGEEGVDGGGGGNKKRRINRYVYSAEDKEYADMIHKEELLRLLRRGYKVNLWTSDETLVVTIMSILPSFLINTTRYRVDEHLRDIIAWFNLTFTLQSNQMNQQGRDGSNQDVLLEVFMTKSGTLHQLTQIFIVVLRICNFNTRYVCSIDPIGKHPRNHPEIIPSNKNETTSADTTDTGIAAASSSSKKEPKRAVEIVPWVWAEVCIPLPPQPASTTASSSSSSNTSDRTPNKRSLPTTRSVGSKSMKVSSKNVMKSSDEIIDLIEDDSNDSTTTSTPITSRWVHIEFNKGLIDQPRSIEERINRNFTYVIAYTVENTIIDVTARYSNQYGSCCKDRLVNSDIFYSNLFKYWPFIYSCKEISMDMIENINLQEDASTSAVSSSSSTTINEYDESSELMHLSTIEVLPTTIKGMTNHAKYILERDLNKYEILHPTNKTIVGLIKGESIYLREHVSLLKSKYSWKKEMRLIKENETPIRSIQKKRGNKNAI